MLLGFKHYINQYFSKKNVSWISIIIFRIMSFTFYFQEVLAERRRKKLALKVSFLFSLYHHYTCNLFGHGRQCQWYRHMYCIVFFIFTFLLLEKQHKSKSKCVFHFTRFLLWDKPLKRDWQCCIEARGEEGW